MNQPQRQPILSVDRAVVGYGGHGLLPPLDLRICPGECWALVGRNGAGKSTLMRSVLDLQPLLFGQIQRRPGLRIAFVPQRAHFDLSVPSRVRDFVAGGLDTGWRFLRPWLGRADRAHVESVLEVTDTATLACEPFAALSEGQRQRALIARALASRPQLLVLDEPTSAMDPINERAVFALLRRLCQAGAAEDEPLAVLLASHQMSFLPDFASHCVIVDKDLGIAEVGPAQRLFRGATFARIYGSLEREPEARGDHAD